MVLSRRGETCLAFRDGAIGGFDLLGRGMERRQRGVGSVLRGDGCGELCRGDEEGRVFSGRSVVLRSIGMGFEDGFRNGRILW